PTPIALISYSSWGVTLHRTRGDIGCWTAEKPPPASSPSIMNLTPMTPPCHRWPQQPSLPSFAAPDADRRVSPSLGQRSTRAPSSGSLARPRLARLPRLVQRLARYPTDPDPPRLLEARLRQPDGQLVRAVGVGRRGEVEEQPEERGGVRVRALLRREEV